MLTQSNISKKNKSSDLEINKGVELILGGTKPKSQNIKPLVSGLKKCFLYSRKIFILILSFLLPSKTKKFKSGEVSWKL